MTSEILDILDQMHPISLGEIKDVSLMNRIDTKYLITEPQLLDILKRIKGSYYVQETEGHRLSPYDTIYYDTPSLAMYMVHHSKHLVRDKVRVRTYVDSNLTFCEVKHKSNKGRTSKKRIKIDFCPDVTQDKDVCDFLAQNQPYDPETLKPNLETVFDRITLVNFEKTERLTVDCHLVFNNLAVGTTASMDDLVVMELKQDGRAYSLLNDVLFNLRIKPFNISKYCIGTCMTRPEVKHNRFKKKLIRIQKMKSSIQYNHDTVTECSGF